MAFSNFRNCYLEVRKHEGGYANHPRDPGGATMWGVTQATYDGYRKGIGVFPRDVRQITEQEALDIYRAGYWKPVRGDDLPEGLDLVGFDGSVNSGPPRGARWLQKGVGAKVDGKVGPETVFKARQADIGAIARACAARMAFLTGLRIWDAFGRGWSRRVASVEAVATRMWIAAEMPGVKPADELASRADKAEAQADTEKKAGQAQAGGAVTGGGAAGVGGENAGIPWEALAFGAVAIVIVAAALGFRAWRRSRYQRDLAEAFRQEAADA